MKWVDDLPIEAVEYKPRNNFARRAAELLEQPGRWAEFARYEAERKGSALSRGSQTCKRYPALEYAVRRDGDEFVLYFRAKESTVNADHTDTRSTP